MMNLCGQTFGSAEIFIPSHNPTYRITLSGQLVVICTFLMDPLRLLVIGCSALTHLCIRETDLRHHILWQTYTSGSIVLGHLIILKIDGIADQLAFWWPRRLLLLQRVPPCTHLSSTVVHPSIFLDIAQNWSAKALREFSKVHLAPE